MGGSETGASAASAGRARTVWAAVVAIAVYWGLHMVVPGWVYWHSPLQQQLLIPLSGHASVSGEWAYWGHLISTWLALGIVAGVLLWAVLAVFRPCDRRRVLTAFVIALFVGQPLSNMLLYSEISFEIILLDASYILPALAVAVLWLYGIDRREMRKSA
ncbi:hypothetical protein CAI21_18280 [Alkalilimnicola ehrlichii]|uniref:Uncharacterized protein n=1 Tax=Alkalilimnicola ehrlichii TaxID=351052 RepID=A0A3E0WSC9_9GAMM|nr:hypothetical protein [Alkalilimnicola ehrlichii]RFA25805.1 hypothetical protein CAI21_18280 [Alkalilimnicola ehrlichii]RFA35093.1 hypothetical protein CAL65_13360 [Alkalilimnicola ehrlichii]